MVEYHPTITDLALSDITVGDRLRPVSEATTAALCHVIGEHGFTVPILVRKKRSGFVLIDGAHRLAAMARRGAARIPVMAVSCTDIEARSMETTQNLAGASLSPLDDALFLAAYSAAYEELHPETRRGIKGALSRHGLANELSSFADVIAEKRSVTVRQVQKIVAAGRMISRDEAGLLRQAPHRITLKDVETIGKIGEPDERRRVVALLAEGGAKTAAKARLAVSGRARGRVDPAVKDPVEAAFARLIVAWTRASVAARKRFLLEYAREVWETQNKGPALSHWKDAAK